MDWFSLQQLRRIGRELKEAAESIPGSEAVVKTFSDLLQFGDAHAAVCKQWGRYPHRNKILGRDCTPEEAAGIADGSIPAW